MEKRAVLLVTLGDEASSHLRERLHLEHRPSHAHPSLWISYGHVEDLIPELRSLLARGELRSAVMLPDVPPEDHLWVAYEWRGKLVVHEALMHLLHRGREQWTVVSRHEPMALVVLAPGATPDRPKVKEVRGADEYHASLRSSEPVVVRFRLSELRRSERVLERWFGELADPSVGGAMALLTLSGARDNSEEVVLRNPNALGLDLEDDNGHLSAHCRRGELHVAACGGSWSDDRGSSPLALAREAVPMDRRDQASLDSVAHALADELAHVKEMEAGSSYFLLMAIAANVDPEVVIPTGAIFEQKALNGVQTLAAAQPKAFQVDVGQLLPVALPAWCLNRSLRAPRGELVRVTPLRFTGGGTQDSVWDDLQRRLEATAL